MSIGIVGYGKYVPKNRRKIVDEDTVTIAVAAAKNAFICSRVSPENIGALFIGSESHPYAVKPTSTIVGEAIGLKNEFFTADVEFACKGGTAAMQICYSFVKSKMASYALAIGADVAQAAPGDVLEKFAAAGGAAFILGDKKDEIIATIDQTLSITSDTPDFWRRNTQKYPSHTNRFTGEPSYFKHVILATRKILAKTDLQPKDFSHVIFHQPNEKFPVVVAKRLGFTFDQIKHGLIFKKIGNPYSANSLLGLAYVLDVAKKGEKILLVSYGSGAGSDAFVLTASGGAI
jgi:hydroxymethylglutaryl-CoA synthase